MQIRLIVTQGRCKDECFRYKIDKFTDKFIDKGNVRKDFVEIIETEPELDSNGYMNYFTKVRSECINKRILL